MGVMVLDGQDGSAQLSGVFRREILGVQVANHQARLGVVKRLQVRHCPAESRVSLPRLQVADVLADERLATNRQGYGILQMRAYGQYRRRVSRILRGGARLGLVPHRQRHGQRRVAAGAPQHQFAVQHNANHRIVHVTDDGPVVDQEDIGDAMQPFQRFPLVGTERLVAEIAAGGDNGKAQLAHQQVVDGSVRQHHPQVGVPRRDGHGQWGAARRACSAPQQDNGRLGRA